MADVRVRLLGPVGAEVDGRQVKLGSQLRMVLAVLALARGHAVSRDRLMELLWGEPVPSAAAATLRSHLAHLRRLIEPTRASGEAPRIVVTEDRGYALRLPADGLDLVRFERLVTEGRQALRAGDARAAADRLNAALDLWHGPALADVADRSFAVAEVARLDALRTSARRLRVEAELALGRHEDVVAELRELVAADPVDEQLRGQLAVALYRCHQVEAATEVCAEGLRLAHERGLDAPALQALQTDILRRTPTLGWSAPRRPFQLPPDIPEFTGRTEELASITDRLSAPAGTVPVAATVPVVAIDGKPGIGKSALAVHVAHRLAARFGDGVLYVNLRGAEPHQLSPVDVLGRFLRALGVPDQQVPPSLDAVAAAFRTALTDRRVLVVLDNAADAAQVRPLLPADPGCAVLITSRRPLVDLDVAGSVTLDLLTTDDAVMLLGRLAGADRVAADPGSARAVVRYCGLLPLAVRIAGARLRARPTWSVASIAARLADERRRLAELAVGDLAVQSSFQLSYQALSPADARLFRLLGLLHGADFGVEVAAVLAQRPVADAEQALERLVDAQLLETHAAGRYRFHDLLRLFAGQCALADDGEASGQAAVAKALRWYAERAELAARWLHEPQVPGVAGQPFTSEQAALTWLDLERANIVAAATQAAAAAPAPVAAVAWQLDKVLVRYFHFRKLWSEWCAVANAAAKAAAKAGEPGAEGTAHRHLGMMCIQQRRYTDGLDHLRRGVALLRQAGAHDEEAKALSDLGIMHGELAEWDRAADYFSQALAAAVQIGNRRLEAHALNNLGLVYAEQGRFDEAVEYVQRTVAILGGLGDQLELSNSYDSLGSIYLKQGRHAEALSCYQRCLATARRHADRYNEAKALDGLGRAVVELQGPAAARPYWEQAHAIFAGLNAPEAEDVELLLSDPRPTGH